MTPLAFGRGRLRPTHNLTAFDCGVEVLNAWLRDYAIHALRSGTAHTVVWTLPDPERVVAYYAISATALAAEEVPASWRAGGGPQPTYLIAKLALDRSLQGRGLGGELLNQALRHIVRLADSGSGRFIAVDPIDDAAAAFYAHHGFVANSDGGRMIRKVASARAALATPAEGP